MRRAVRLPALLVLFVSVTLVLGLTAAVTTTAAHASVASIRPNKVGELDCNGLSPVQRPAKPSVQCLDPRGSDGGRFEDNGHYIGHDEPSVRFLSSQPGSGDDTMLTERLPVEPAALPTASHPGRDVTHTFELTLAPDSHTLLMNPGDAITLHMFNAKIPGGHALEARETDLTTGQSGFMIASAANGFMNTNPADCSVAPARRSTSSRSTRLRGRRTSFPGASGLT